MWNFRKFIAESRARCCAPILFFVLLALTGCAKPAGPVAATQPASQTLTVLAAASLTESFTEIGRIFEQQNPGVAVQFSFAGSQQLAQQLGQGAGADVFASASPKYIDAAIDAGRVQRSNVHIFAKNRLTVIYPNSNAAGLKTLQDLAKPGIKIVLADKSAPVGQYALDFLEKATTSGAFNVSFQNDVLKNVVSYEDNVKAVATKVMLNEADAGIVYLTDVTGKTKETISTLAIPDNLNTIASYPLAKIADSTNPEQSAAFIDLVLSAQGQSILAKYGFSPAE